MKDAHRDDWWPQTAPSRSMRRVTVEDTSSVTSSASSSTELFPDDFDHKRYSNKSHVVKTSIPAQRSQSHNQSRSHSQNHSRSHSHKHPDQSTYTYGDKYSGDRHRSKSHLTNGHSGSTKPGTYRTVSFDSGFEADTSKNRLSSFSSDDSSRWREIRPEMPTTHVDKTDRSMGKPVEKKFLRKVQRELEDQRSQWEGEVDDLTGSMARMPNPSGSQVQGESSYVDNASGKPIFKAFVDMKGYPAKNISVTVDNISNKVIVTALDSRGSNGVTRTFTQKIALPRFADDQSLTSRLSKSGTLKIEVPLMYYFPQPDDAKARDRKAKSFVYQVEKQSRDGPRVLEILVNTGSEYKARELKVLVEDDNKLVILGEKHTQDSRGKSGVQRKLIKQYSLPGLADVDRITSKLGKDGRLQVNVPLKD